MKFMMVGRQSQTRVLKTEPVSSASTASTTNHAGLTAPRTCWLLVLFALRFLVVLLSFVSWFGCLGFLLLLLFYCCSSFSLSFLEYLTLLFIAIPKSTFPSILDNFIKELKFLDYHSILRSQLQPLAHVLLGLTTP